MCCEWCTIIGPASNCVHHNRISGPRAAIASVKAATPLPVPLMQCRSGRQLRRRAARVPGRIALIASGFLLAGGACALAGADTEPVIVVPGRPGVAIMIDGQDVRGAVIEGEWGLARGHTGITIIRPWPGNLWPRVFGTSRWLSPAGRYYPVTGKPPPIGRLEVVPPADRALPPRAQSFERIWGVKSAPLPATIEPTYPYEMPPGGISPRRDRDSGRRGPSSGNK